MKPRIGSARNAICLNVRGDIWSSQIHTKLAYLLDRLYQKNGLSATRLIVARILGGACLNLRRNMVLRK